MDVTLVEQLSPKAVETKENLNDGYDFRLYFIFGCYAFKYEGILKSS